MGGAAQGQHPSTSVCYGPFLEEGALRRDASSAPHEARRGKGSGQGILRTHQLGRGPGHHCREDEGDQGRVWPLWHLPLAVSELREERLSAGALVGGRFWCLGRAFHLGTCGRRDAALGRRPDQGHARPAELDSGLRGSGHLLLQAPHPVGHGPGRGMVRADVLLHEARARIRHQDHHHRSALHPVGRAHRRPVDSHPPRHRPGHDARHRAGALRGGHARSRVHREMG